MAVIKKYNESTSQWEAIAIGEKGDTGEGVPAGGSAGQVLAKASGTAYDTVWSTLGSTLGGNRSGWFQWTSGKSLTNRAHGAQEVYFVPINIDTASTFDQIAIYVVTGAASGSIRLGIYNESVGGVPSGLLQDFGTVSTATSSTTVTITISLSLSPGRYWLASKVESSGATIRCYLTGGGVVQALADPSIGPSSGWSLGSASGGGVTYRKDSGVSAGSLPADGTPQYGSNYDQPIFRLRHA